VDYVDLICITKSLIHLNIATFSDLNSLILFLILLLVCKSNYIQNLTFCTLINSEYIYYFINTTFVLKYNIFIKPTLPIELKLFDGLSNNIITKTASLPVIFPFRNQIILNIYVTLLNFFYSLILKYN